MRALSVVLVVACLAPPSIRGSIQQSAQTPVFRSTVTLVPVDVTVLDHDGKPVPGLSAGDFEVKLDGHSEPVRTVSYEETPTAHTAPAGEVAEAPREVTNATPKREPRVVVLLVDDLVIPATRDKSLFLSASRFVGGMPSSDLVGFTTSTGAVSVNPTLDRAAVESGLHRLSGSFVDPRDLPPPVAVGLGEAEEINAGDRSLLQAVMARDCAALQMQTASCPEDVQKKVRAMGALVQDTTDRQILSYLGVIKAMGDLPGQKVLIVMTDGMVVSERGKNQAVGLQPIAQAAAAAGVEFNVLFADSDAVSMNARSSADGEMQRADSNILMQGIQTVADLTGGNFYRVMGQPDRFFGFVAEAVSGVYHLGVEMPSGAAQGHNFSLSARVNRDGLVVHANRVAVVPVVAAPVPTSVQLQDAVVKGLPNYGVPLAVATVVRRGEAADTLDVGANVDVPGSVSGPITMMFGLVDAKGKMRTGQKAIAAPADGSDYRVSLSLPVTPGPYRLRFAVADGAGHLGSLDKLVDAQLTRVGPFLVSDVMTAWAAGGGPPQFLALEEVPTTATSFGAFLELYQAPNTPVPTDVRIQWSLVGGPQTVADQTVVPVQGKDRLTAQSRFEVASLPAATYELRATILVAGEAVGVVSTTIHKAEKSPRASVAPVLGWRH